MDISIRLVEEEKRMLDEYMKLYVSNVLEFVLKEKYVLEKLRVLLNHYEDDIRIHNYTDEQSMERLSDLIDLDQLVGRERLEEIITYYRYHTSEYIDLYDLEPHFQGIVNVIEGIKPPSLYRKK